MSKWKNLIMFFGIILAVAAYIIALCIFENPNRGLTSTSTGTGTAASQSAGSGTEVSGTRLNDDGSYFTWTGYDWSGSTWNDVADAIDSCIANSYDAYLKGDKANAVEQVYNQAYFGIYEVTGFERVVMGSISGARVTEVETAFMNCRKAARADDEAVLKDHLDTLSRLIREDANVLDGKSGAAASSSESTASVKLNEDGSYFTWTGYDWTGSTWNDVADAIDSCIENSYDAFQKGDKASAVEQVYNQAYFGIYEVTGFERVVMGSISGARVTEVETAFMNCRKAARADDAADLRAHLDTLSQLIREDANVLDGNSGASAAGEESSGTSSTAWIANFSSSMAIIIREGLEAILIVGAVVAYLVKAGHKDKLKFVYLGCVLAVGASILMAIILNILMSANGVLGGMSQEAIEGITMLFAVCILFYTSNWMVSKSESDLWNTYIEGKVQSSVTKGSVFALAFTAFLAVFREGAEVILFYQALLSTTSGAGDQFPIWLAFGIGIVILAAVYFAIRFFSIKIPLKPFFLGTSILMFLMTVSFIGNGVKELMEAGWIEGNLIPWLTIPVNDFFEILGIYGYYETMIPMVALLIISIISFIWQMMDNKKQKARIQAAREQSEQQESKPDDQSQTL